MEPSKSSGSVHRNIVSATYTFGTEVPKTRKFSEARWVLSEVVGEEGLAGKPMQAGALLDLIDICAGRMSAEYCGGPVATVAFDRVEIRHPILHLDLVRLEAQVVAVGKSSMVVKVDCYRHDLQSRSFQHVHACWITMVAIDPTGRPVTTPVPALIYETPEEESYRNEAEKRKAATAQWTKMLEQIDTTTDISAASLQAAAVALNANSHHHGGSGSKVGAEGHLQSNGKVNELLSIPETRITLSRMFFPKHLNINNTIFGGDILLWMDRAATAAARNFTRNRNVYTVALNRIGFKKPVFVTDWVEMQATVVYVHGCKLEVDIEVFLRKPAGERMQSHSGHFTILNCNEAGFKQEVVTGLRLSDEDIVSLRRCAKAQKRVHFEHSQTTQRDDTESRF